MIEKNEKHVVYVDPWELLASTIVTTMAKDYLEALKNEDEDEIIVGEAFFTDHICDKYLSFSTITKEDIRERIMSEYRDWKKANV